MLTVSQLSKSYAGRALFDDVSLQVNRGDRIGLVGPNGAGKSTLFSLLLGDVSPDKGTIAIEKNATIGFLPQETAAAGDETVLELALAVAPELAHSKRVRYRGDWDSYVEQKAAREEQQLAAYKNQQKEIASLQLFADRFRAKASKASQAQSKLKQIDRMKKIAAPVARGKTIKFHFPQPVRSGLRVITLKDVDHAYDDLVVYRGLQYEAERGQRTVLVGPNGAGKSTLLSLLAGVLPMQHGAHELGHNVRAGYFSQN